MKKNMCLLLLLILCLYGCKMDNHTQLNTEPTTSQNEYGYYIKKGTVTLIKNINEFHQSIVADGTYDDMIERWVNTLDPPPMPKFKTGTKGTLTFATSCLVPAFAYYGQDGEMLGFEIEYARRFAEYMNMTIVIDDYNFTGCIAAVQHGKADFGGSLVLITEERSKILDFAEPYYVGDLIPILANSIKEDTSFIDTLVSSFKSTLIVEVRHFHASHDKKANQDSLHDPIPITEKSTYWIRFADFVKGKIIDANNISEAVEIVFAPNVYEQSLTFTTNNDWEVTGKNANNANSKAIGEIGFARSGFRKTNTDTNIEKKSYEKPNYLCGYGCFTNSQPFDDFTHITKLSIWSEGIIDGLEITYSNGKTYKHGSTHDACETLKFTKDSIVKYGKTLQRRWQIFL